MTYSFERLIEENLSADPVIVDSQGQPVIFIRIDDVWGPSQDVTAGHENAKFILASLNGASIEFPENASPGPWWIEPDEYARENGYENACLLSARSPEGKETLALFDEPMREAMQSIVDSVPEAGE